ncbi:MAG: IPT/TIG domain-containing protein [Theionarchaea archaeon]|nr:IPT/TIG domain-containing protein [Theionarchaea archaeon]
MKRSCLFCVISVLIVLSLVKADAPTIVEARSGQDGAVFLKWNGSGDLFVVYRGEESQFETAEEIARVNTTAYTDYSGTNGTTYYYWITVLSDGDESPPSPPAHAVCDREAPTCSITSPVDGAHITGALTIQGISADGETGVSQVEVSINGVWYFVAGTSSWQFSLSSPPEGEVVIACRCQDKALNMSEPVQITVVVESISPEIFLITPDEAESGTQTAAQVSGRNFVETPQVFVGVHACTINFDSDSLLTVIIPPLDVGVYDVTVINPDGKSDTLHSGFTVFTPNTPPAIVSTNAVPQFVPNNGTTTVLLTAHVEDADDNIQTVVIDLSEIGGGITQMKDDGIHPDKTAGDHIYSTATVVTKDIPEGVYSLVVTATDDQGAADTGFVVLNVVEDPPDNPPELLSYQVTPSSGTSTTIFRYTVTYKDQDNNAPTYVTITITGVGTFNMTETDPSDYTYMNGKDYYYEYSGLGTGTHSYTISASDGTNPVSVGATGPTVSGTNTAPDLLSPQITPSSGTQTTNFRYQVTYRDQDNDDPVSITVTITGVGTFNMAELDPTDQYYKDGKVYYYDYTAGLSVGTHSYTITADDGTDTTSLGGTGPTVTADANTPPVLSSDSVTPSTGTQTTNFRYKVTYTDQDNDDCISITVTITGVGTFNMVELDPTDQYYKNGKVYYYDYTAGLSVGTHSYTITADDGTDTTSLGGTGPTVTADANTPPVLSNASVTPTCGNTSTVFIYQVTYTDQDNDDPVSITVTITGIGTFNMVELDPTDQYYKNGKVYYYVYTGGFPLGTQSYTITADDGTDTTSLGGTGPDIPVGDCAPPTPPVPPSINIYPVAGPSGAWVTITGTGFAPSENNITVTFAGAPVTLIPLGATTPGGSPGTVKADASGTFSAKFKVPPSSPGPKSVDAHGDATAASSVPNKTFTVMQLPLPPYSPPPSAQPPSDTLSPDSIITYPKSGSKLKGTFVTVKGTASDNKKVVKVEVSFDNGVTWHTASGTETWSYKWKLPTDGIYTIRSRATDDEGNVELVEGKATIIVDNTPPTVRITTDFEDIEDENSFLIEGIASDNDMVKRVEITTDGGSTWELVEGAGVWTYQWNPEDGMYTLQAKAWDDLGHVGYSEIITVVVDTTPPELYISTPDRTEISGDTFLITGTAYDANGIDYVEVAIGEEAYERAQGTESWSYLWVLPEESGEYPIYVRAWDNAGLTTFHEITLIVAQPGEGVIGGLSRLHLIIIAGVIIVVGLAAGLLIIYFRG